MPGPAVPKHQVAGFQGRHRWRRQQLFKLRATPPQDEKSMIQKRLSAKRRRPQQLSANKICDSLNPYAPHNK
jgi:hypothetical protein